MAQETGFDPIEDVCGRIDFARRLYTADLQAMPDQMLRRECGGKARTAYDVTFELTMMYEGFASLLAEGQGAIPAPQGWVRAPEEFKNADGARAAFDGALGRFVAAFRSYRGNAYQDEYQSPVGAFTPIGMANLAVWHTMYHSGQLNFIQTLCGDDSFHWAG
jgi:hypothetical protein